MFGGLGGIGHWVVLALVILVLFGRGRISEMMGDFGKGINSFKKGLNEGAETPAAPPPAQIPAPEVTPAASAPAPSAPAPATPAPSASETNTTTNP